MPLMSAGLTWSSKFQYPPLQALEKMLMTRLHGLKVEKSCLRELAQNVHLAPSHIDKAAKVASYCGARKPEDTGKILQTVIDNAHKALNLKGKKGFGHHLDATYSLAHVNADHNLESLVKCCRQFPGVRLFLHGPPGSEKSAFVQYLGHVLAKPVPLKTFVPRSVKMRSSRTSCSSYHGMTRSLSKSAATRAFLQS
jgi:hypothetical protein